LRIRTQKEKEDMIEEHGVKTGEEVEPEELAPKPYRRGILPVEGPAAYREGKSE
jgi:hypothetical protein